MDKELILVPRATLDIYRFEEDGLTCYEFNATECQPPEPMVNSIVCLNLLKSENDRLIVTYFHEPTPLYDRISDKYSYKSVELDSGDVRVVFKLV
ncbi:hypothetical protein [Sulfurimonas sp.]